MGKTAIPIEVSTVLVTKTECVGVQKVISGNPDKKKKITSFATSFISF